MAICGYCQHTRFDHPGAMQCAALDGECPCTAFKEQPADESGSDEPATDDENH